MQRCGKLDQGEGVYVHMCAGDVYGCIVVCVGVVVCFYACVHVHV